MELSIAELTALLTFAPEEPAEMGGHGWSESEVSQWRLSIHVRSSVGFSHSHLGRSDTELI